MAKCSVWQQTKYIYPYSHEVLVMNLMVMTCVFLCNKTYMMKAPIQSQQDVTLTTKFYYHIFKKEVIKCNFMKVFFMINLLIPFFVHLN